jgi:hypothetical protein
MGHGGRRERERRENVAYVKYIYIDRDAFHRS